MKLSRCDLAGGMLAYKDIKPTRVQIPRQTFSTKRYEKNISFRDFLFVDFW